LRRERHRAAAAFLEDSVGEIGDVVPALANHWAEAGEPARAAGYMITAGDQAGRGWAKYEAAGYYRRALELLPEEDRARRREITKRQAVAMQVSLHLAEVLAGRGAGRPASSRA
jgi:hypothetical protein